MKRMNYSPRMTQYIAKNRLLANDPLCIVDVGASGGVASYWGIFGQFFKAIGFEPLLAECERLNADKHKPADVTYFPCWIVADEQEVRTESGPQHASKIFKRSSAVKAFELKKTNYAKKYYNVGKDPIYSNQKSSIDQFFSNYPIKTIDFIKIDTDGHDYEVLYGAQHVLNNKQVLGITVESQFHGKSHVHSNVFRNIDRLLTDAGFSLFDLEVYRYTKQDLPGPFLSPVPAETTTGQVLWGEALYFRDFAGEDQISTAEMSPIKLLKLACLFELFGLPDCAAELLNVYRTELAQLIDIQKGLDLLVKNLKKQNSYPKYIKKFENHLEDFYPSKLTILKKKFSRFLKLNMESKKYFLAQFFKQL